MTLTILGLGAGDADDLTRRAWHTLETAPLVWLRTRQHPCVPHLPNTERYHDFDALYREHAGDFRRVYDAIVAAVLAAARAGDVVYAVPGDPLVAETTVLELLAAARQSRLAVEVISGVSFIEPTLRLLEVDALDGLQLYDALTIAGLHHPPLNPDVPALIAQIYDRAVASDVKLTLMNQYADAFEVALVHGAGTADALVERLPLYAIDRSPHFGNLTSLFVPALGGMTSFEHFQAIIAHLRAPEGCPWDKEQTHASLRRYLLEETYEVLETIDNDDPAALAEELGDLLLQIVLHTQIAIDDGEFNMTDVLRHINTKMIARHPHVFGDTQVGSAADVVANWEALKRAEHAAKGVRRESLLDGVPKGLPALMQAFEYQRKAAKVGFDWHAVEDVVAKVREELDEVLSAADDAHRAEEIGDLLFVVANWARWLKVEPETALREANAKFARRFRYIEQTLGDAGRSLDDSTLDELDALWNEAKKTGL